MKKIWCYPNRSKLNQYICSHERVWEKAGYNVNFTDLLLSNVARRFFNKREDALVLNWFEDRVSYAKHPSIELFKSLFILLFIRIKYKKIIWVKHNFKPHNDKAKFSYSFICICMKLFCNKVITHRPIDEFKSLTIPHPLYDIGTIDTNSFRDIKYLYFGTIKKYKGLEALLTQWPIEEPLKIIGYCDNPKLDESIKSIIKERELNVAYTNAFIDKEELDLLISKSEFILLPHHDQSMIVSGAFYHGISLGANVIICKSGFSQYLQSNFGSVNIISLEDMPRQLKKTKALLSTEIIAKAQNCFSDEIIAQQWQKILNN